MEALTCIKLPFNGYIEFTTDKNQMIKIAGLDVDKISISQFIKKFGEKFKFVNDDELNKLYEKYYKSFITDPSEIPYEKYNDALNVLPPCKYKSYGSYLGFHLSERYTGNIVYWYFINPINNKCISFMDDAEIKPVEIINKIEFYFK